MGGREEAVNMTKGKIVEYVSLCIFIIAYIADTIFKENLIGNLIAPLIPLISAHLIYLVYKKADICKFDWLCLLIGCLTWAIADILWAYYDIVLGINPENVELIIYLYMGMNICIVAGLVEYFLKRLKKWNSRQLSLDISAILMVGAILIWIFFFKEQSKTIIHMDLNSFSNYFSVILDSFAISCILITYVSVRSRKVPLTLEISMLGILWFSFTDLVYVYLDYSGKYIPNSLIDSLYTIAIFIFAISAIIEYHKPNIKLSFKTTYGLPENIGTGNKIRILLLIPLALLIFIDSGKGYDGIRNLHEILIISAIIGLHYFISSYVQIAIKNEHLLNKEMYFNDMLEDVIEQRTMQLRKVNTELEELTNLDNLTGLFNRRYFMNEVDKFIATADDSARLAIMYMDLDMFKAINDSYGHDMGDNVLIEVSNQLSAWLPENSVLARLGGDEFVIVLKEESDLTKVELRANEIVELLKNPIVIKPYQFNISISIGIAVYPFDAKERNKLMKYADIAMYHAQTHDHKNVAFYNSFMSDRIERRHELELLIRKVNCDEEFELYYQPQFSIPDKKLVGIEALIRWHSKEKGNVSPAEFIPIAEEIGTIVEIGDWVIKNSIKQIAQWNFEYNKVLRMGINISPKQIDSLNFLTDFDNILKESEIKPEWLDIEITERIAMKGETAMEEAFNSLTSSGVLISIDDFGTGYSSLSYIKTFDIDRIKIAKELIDTISKDDGSIQIVKAIIMMAKAMGLKTIAEGVEDDDQLEKLIGLGCDEIQGYIFSKPITASEFEEKYLKSCTK
jgi:diguanylate cyclase